ncbi:MAG: hypothetical protein ABR497_03985 [Kiritimatiellia bacterium]|nr:hypothetical protein [Lentisphaerota bacterium]
MTLPNQPAEQVADDWSASIGAGDEDVARIVAEIRANVARKMEAGAYRDLRIAQAERHNLRNLRDDEQFLRFYLECLHEAAAVDINDFEIRERRRWGGRLLVAVKKSLWHLLKFYTYRLWSQQNQVNGLLVTALESVDEKYRRRIAALEQRLAALESGSGEGESACPRPGA